jgi:hypothetical protein
MQDGHKGRQTKAEGGWLGERVDRKKKSKRLMYVELVIST